MCVLYEFYVLMMRASPEILRSAWSETRMMFPRSLDLRSYVAMHLCCGADPIPVLKNGVISLWPEFFSGVEAVDVLPGEFARLRPNSVDAIHLLGVLESVHELVVGHDVDRRVLFFHVVQMDRGGLLHFGRLFLICRVGAGAKVKICRSCCGRYVIIAIGSHDECVDSRRIGDKGRDEAEDLLSFDHFFYLLRSDK